MLERIVLEGETADGRRDIVELGAERREEDFRRLEAGEVEGEGAEGEEVGEVVDPDGAGAAGGVRGHPGRSREMRVAEEAEVRKGKMWGSSRCSKFSTTRVRRGNGTAGTTSSTANARWSVRCWRWGRAWRRFAVSWWIGMVS